MAPEHPFRMTRRTFLGNAGQSLGLLGLGHLMAGPAAASTPVQGGSEAGRWLGVVHPPHRLPRVKRVIHLCMAGGPSHLETFDQKPELLRRAGQPMPASVTEGQPIAQLQGKELTIMPPAFGFSRVGESGQLISDILPHTQTIADDICVIRSMVTEQINHDPAHTFFNTGTQISGRPSMGSWVLYGLGAEADDLPGFVVLVSEGGGQGQPISSRQWHSGFLPSKFQGVQLHSTGSPVHYVDNPPGVDTAGQEGVVQAVNRINALRNQALDDPEISTRISQYEMAFAMQMSIPELTDFSQEPRHIIDMYGCTPGDGSFASNCLLARRLAERGVRFIQLYHRGWDHHGELEKGMRTTCGLVDKPTAALIRDLKQRGMLDDTLVIWGGEFGRTPMAQGTGRDHHIKGYSMWLAGGGIRPGFSWGATDELGYNAVENVVTVHDLHATMLHLLGIDHERFTFKYQGLDFRLTGVEPAYVVKGILS
jgi:hypothetical protein